MSRLDTIKERLEAAAYKVTDNFCYGCYVVVEGDRCPHCETDDFMRHMEGVGVEYGTDWVIAELIHQHCKPINEENLYSEMLDECYSMIEIGCLSWYPSYIVMNLDPIAFRCGVSEYIDGLVQDGEYFEYDGGYYRLEDIEEMLDDIEA